MFRRNKLKQLKQQKEQLMKQVTNLEDRIVSETEWSVHRPNGDAKVAVTND